MACGKPTHREAANELYAKSRTTPATMSGLAQGPRMGGRVNLAQLVDGDQGVNLRRRHRCMPEQFLNHANVSAAVEQVRGERVPEHVRRYVRKPGSLRRDPQRAPRALPGQPAAARIQEQGKARGDRKSTRLNSSHQIISYAVFC